MTVIITGKISSQISNIVVLAWLSAIHSSLAFAPQSTVLEQLSGIHSGQLAPSESDSEGNLSMGDGWAIAELPSPGWTAGKDGTCTTM